MNRYMPVLAIMMEDTEFSPIWEWSIDENGTANHPSHGRKYNVSPVEVLWDTKKQKLQNFPLVEYRPKPKYEIGQSVGAEKENHTLTIVTVVDIRDGRFEDNVMKGEMFIRWIEANPKLYNIPLSGINIKEKYTLRTINPAYILSDESIVEYDFQMFGIKEIT